MLSRSFAAALILTTGTAAAGGSYLAMRQSAAESVEAAPAPVPVSAPEQPVPAPVVTPVPGEAIAPANPRQTAPEAVVPRRRPRVPKAEAPQTAPVVRRVAVEQIQVPAQVEAAALHEPVTAAVPTPVPHATDASPDPMPAADPVFYEIVVPASAVIGLEIETTISSEAARVEDRVDARVTRDVYADERLAIPAGSRVIGAVTVSERGGKLKDRARLGVRFHTLVLPGGRQVPMRTEAIYREGDSPGAESSRKIGGAAIGGAVLGAILGGSKGAVTGAGVGAAGGTAAVMAGGRNAATLAGGSVVTVRLSSPMTFEVER